MTRLDVIAHRQHKLMLEDALTTAAIIGAWIWLVVLVALV